MAVPQISDIISLMTRTVRIVLGEDPLGPLTPSMRRASAPKPRLSLLMRSAFVRSTPASSRQKISSLPAPLIRKPLPIHNDKPKQDVIEVAASYKPASAHLTNGKAILPQKRSRNECVDKIEKRQKKEIAHPPTSTTPSIAKAISSPGIPVSRPSTAGGPISVKLESTDHLNHASYRPQSLPRRSSRMVSGKLAMIEARKMMEKEREQEKMELDENEADIIEKEEEKPRKKEVQNQNATGSGSSKESKGAKSISKNLPKLSALPISKGKAEKTIAKVPAKSKMGKLKLRSVPLPPKRNEKNSNRPSAVSRAISRSELPAAQSSKSSAPVRSAGKFSPAPRIMLRSALPEVVRARAESGTALKQQMVSTPVSTPSTSGRRTFSPNSSRKPQTEATRVDRANGNAAASDGPEGGDGLQHVASLLSSRSSSTGRSTDPTVESVLERIGSLERDFRSSVARAFGLKTRKQHVQYIAETMKAVRLSFNIGLSKETELRLRWRGLSSSQKHIKRKDVILHYRKHTASYVQSRLGELQEVGMKEKGSWFRRALHKAYFRIFVLYRLGCEQQKKAQQNMGRKLRRELERAKSVGSSKIELDVRDAEWLQNTVSEYGNLMTLLDIAILDNSDGVEEAGSEAYIP